MTREDALALARQKWGGDAFAMHLEDGSVKLGTCKISWLHSKITQAIKGAGETWEEACRRAGLLPQENNGD